MDLLKKELERKKKAIALAKQQASSSTEGTGKNRKTFLTASQLRRAQEEQEETEREKKRKTDGKDDEGQTSKERKRSRVKVEEKSMESTAAMPTVPSTSLEEESVRDFSASEIASRLRSLGLPIRLFGEITSERMDRLAEAMKKQQNAIAGQSEMEEFRLASGSGHGIRNPFLERKDQDEEEASLVPKSSKSGLNTSDAKVKKDETKGTTGPRSEENENDPHKQIYRFFKDLLHQWEDDLALRPEEVKRSVAGKNETKTLKQCKDYIRPLFKLCKTRRLEPGLTSHLVSIVENCQAGEFVKANDSYMDVAIGRAAWPIGVTMVGIHARTGRAKIESANVAHVMNSELQRKYLTSVKRLMSYHQKKRNDVAPSKKVMN